MKHSRKRSYLSNHHLVPKERVHDHTQHLDFSHIEESRILRLWRDKHDAFHLLFHNLTLEEIIAVLQRIQRIKKM